MWRRLLAVVIGFLVGAIVVGVVEGIGHMIWPPPAGVDASSHEAMANLMPLIPLGAKIAVVVAWALGSFCGGYAAAKTARDGKIVVAVVVGAIFLCAAGYSLYAIPHPVWMAAAGLLLPVPLAWFGGKSAGA